MKKIIIGGAGGAPSEGVINSLINSPENEEIIGIGSEPTDLVMSNSTKKYVVPYANTNEYREVLIDLLKKEKPDLIHFQNDLEIYHASLIRDEILGTGTKLFMPDHEVIDICVHKYKTWVRFKQAGIIVPENIYINDEDDLRLAFQKLGDEKGNIWLRSATIGGGGKGSLPTNNYEMAKAWIDRYEGWGEFVAAEMLTQKTVTWQSIWYEGKLVVAQTRARAGWIHGNRSVSGVTGVTKVGRTVSNTVIDEIAIKSIYAVDSKPHGVFGVDMAYDFNGIPNPTEINISRFFTTILFFTEAGLNMPLIFKDLVLYGKFPDLEKKINPLPDGLNWLRGMDTKPRLMTDEQIANELTFLLD